MTDRTINCPIHGVINLTPRMCSIIDTPEFQRLHRLRQLGVTHFVYPSATHTRFEHSIGVSHLAKIVLLTLQNKHPELKIDDNLIELYQVAALLHDIGHGPFSHLYDDEIINPEEVHHEDRGISIFKNMIERYTLSFNKREINFIVNLIEPSKELENDWFYQIINNKLCSVDVDKIDYIQRDCYHLGFGINDTFERLLTMCEVKNMVIGSKVKLVLAWPTKLQDEIMSLFETRYRLHKRVYNHHTVKAIEQIVTKLLLEIKKSCNIDLSGSFDDIISFPFQNHTINNLQRRLEFRHHPKLIGEKIITICKSPDSNESEEIENKINNLIAILSKKGILTSKIMKTKIGFISGNGSNPLNNVPYFKKGSNEATTVDKYDTFMDPKNCQEYIYRLYVLSNDRIEEASSLWNTIIK